MILIVGLTFVACSDKENTTAPQISYIDNWSDTISASGYGECMDTTLSHAVRRAGAINAAKLELKRNLKLQLKDLQVTDTKKIGDLMEANDTLNLQIENYSDSYYMNDEIHYVEAYRLYIRGGIATSGLKSILKNNGF